MKKRVLSGIRATGRLHIGNYLGAIKGMIDLQEDKDFETYYMVADLHGITTPYNKDTFEESVKSVVLDYLSAGIDPERSTLFIQSMVKEHVQLANYLASLTSVARMFHLPTYKEKVSQNPKEVSMALLNYPILMASDILLYKSTHVPVGQDQEPHLEVARELARKMNQMYRTQFPEPVVYSTRGKYVPSLLGVGKMSKSVEGSSIFLVDSLEEIQKKIARIPTDSGKGSFIPTTGGVASLAVLIELFEGEDSLKVFTDEYTSFGVRYSEVKDSLAKSIFKVLEPMQTKRKEFESKNKLVKDIINEGAQKAQLEAAKTLIEVENKMGLNYSFKA